MMHLFAALVFGVLAFGSQVVLCSNFKFKFSPVEQCQPVAITFEGDPTVDGIPTALTLLPFNGRPISIPLPDAGSNSSGVEVNFLPLAEGTTFIASLDDGNGESCAKASDVLRVLPSPTGNTTCLPAQVANGSNAFTLPSKVTQCEEFTVKYDRSVTRSAPSIRLFSPEKHAVNLNQTRDDPDNGEATYLLSFSRGKQIVLSLDDGGNNQRVTEPITVLGDASSNSDCLSSSSKIDIMNSNLSGSAVAGPSNAVVLGLSIGGSIVLLVALCMLFFVIRERRRRRFVNIEFDPNLLEKAPEGRSPKDFSRPTPVFANATFRESFIQDPPYAEDMFASTAYSRTSIPSWSQVLSADQRQSVEGTELQLSPRYQSHLSLNPMDIEGILNSHSNRNSHQDSPLPSPTPSPGDTPSPRPLPQIMTRPYPARGHLRDPSDVPVDLTSITLSTYSANPFSDDHVASDSIISRTGSIPLVVHPGNQGRMSDQSSITGVESPTTTRNPLLRGRIAAREVNVPSPLRLSRPIDTNMSEYGVAR